MGVRSKRIRSSKPATLHSELKVGLRTLRNEPVKTLTFNRRTTGLTFVTHLVLYEEKAAHGRRQMTYEF